MSIAAGNPLPVTSPTMMARRLSSSSRTSYKSPPTILAGRIRAWTLTLLWAVYGLFVYPLQTRAKLLNDATKQGASCYEGGDSEERKVCVKLWSDIMAHESEEWSLRGFYKAAGLYILGTIMIVPAVVYGFCRLIGFTFVWVYKGFRAV